MNNIMYIFCIFLVNTDIFILNLSVVCFKINKQIRNKSFLSVAYNSVLQLVVTFGTHNVDNLSMPKTYLMVYDDYSLQNAWINY